ncbi:MAG TPA: ABC transporter ATP-binding protein [Vicinamibacteria bacterium]|nr:ABC transporter ATP-binding protein [Vicinamibacteria bacterium]
MQPVLEVRELSKRFRDREAVRSLSFQLSPGEIFGLLGPNGAGKTTTIGMIAGVLRPTAGSIRILGADTVASGRSVLRRLGLVPQTVALYPALTAEENLRFFGNLYGLPREHLEARVGHLLELAGLSARKNEPVAEFSGGMKRRLNLVCALVHEPALLLLDEPTAGVDPQSRERIYEALAALAREGLALLLTTHYLEEAERLCHRIAILDEGRVAAEGTVAHLRALAGEKPTVTIVVARPPGAELAAKLAEREAISEDPRRFHLQSAGAEKLLTELLALAAAEGNEVEELLLHRPNLGDVFLRLTGKALRD